MFSLPEFVLVLILAAGCAGASRTTGSPNCSACDLDVDYTVFEHESATKTTSAQRRQPRVARGAPRDYKPIYRPARYRGRKIDLDFKDLDIHDAFRVLARVGGTNIVVSDEVKGRLTMALHRVPWDQALVTIVAVKRLRLVHRDGVYLIMPRALAHTP